MTDTAVRTDADALAAAQRSVIDESGWGARFRVIQPRNFTFWVMVFLFIYGVPLTIKGFSAAADAYTESFAQGAAWFMLFAWLGHPCPPLYCCVRGNGSVTRKGTVWSFVVRERHRQAGRSALMPRTWGAHGQR